MHIETSFTQKLGIEKPLLMAPMFLVSNEAMIQQAILSGIAGCFPSLNFRDTDLLHSVLDRLNNFKDLHAEKGGTFGVNLIVQKTNPYYQKHLEICVAQKVPFYITSLGNPKTVIEKAHEYGAKVFCDVTNLTHAQKCFELNADGFIAVGQGAGGHAGPYPLGILVPALKKKFPGITIVAAGGVADGSAILSLLAAGADAVSIGTRFIASTEATVSEAYKNSVVESGMEDIVLSSRISGTPCTIINTPYAKKIGYEQNQFEKFLSRNPRTKKYFKMLVQIRGMKKLEQAVKPGSYNNLWCAGQSVEMINDIKPTSKIIEDLLDEMETAYKLLKDKIS
jgi:nitronate monooxygenase